MKEAIERLRSGQRSTRTDSGERIRAVRRRIMDRIAARSGGVDDHCRMTEGSRPEGSQMDQESEPGQCEANGGASSSSRVQPVMMNEVKLDGAEANDVSHNVSAAREGPGGPHHNRITEDVTRCHHGTFVATSVAAGGKVTELTIGDYAWSAEAAGHGEVTIGPPCESAVSQDGTRSTVGDATGRDVDHTLPEESRGGGGGGPPKWRRLNPPQEPPQSLGVGPSAKGHEESDEHGVRPAMKEKERRRDGSADAEVGAPAARDRGGAAGPDHGERPSQGLIHRTPSARQSECVKVKRSDGVFFITTAGGAGASNGHERSAVCRRGAAAPGARETGGEGAGQRREKRARTEDGGREGSSDQSADIPREDPTRRADRPSATRVVRREMSNDGGEMTNGTSGDQMSDMKKGKQEEPATLDMRPHVVQPLRGGGGQACGDYEAVVATVDSGDECGRAAVAEAMQCAAAATDTSIPTGHSPPMVRSEDPGQGENKKYGIPCAKSEARHEVRIRPTGGQASQQHGTSPCHGTTVRVHFVGHEVNEADHCSGGDGSSPMQHRHRRLHGRPPGGPNGTSVVQGSSSPGSSSDLIDSRPDPSNSCDIHQNRANAARDLRRAERPPAPGDPRSFAVREREAQNGPPGLLHCSAADDEMVRDLDGGRGATIPSDVGADTNVTSKRRRIRGKQHQGHCAQERVDEALRHAGGLGGANAARGTRGQSVGANPTNSMHGTGSAGPSRSDSSTVDRLPPRLDRDGQVLPVATLASGSGDASGGGWRYGATIAALTTMRGRPPEADAPFGGCRGAS